MNANNIDQDTNLVFVNFPNKAGYHQSPSGKLRYSNDVKNLITLNNLKFLIEIIENFQQSDEVKNQNIQVWELKMLANQNTTLIMRDIDETKNIITQRLDIRYNQIIPIELWLIGGTLMLPEECCIIEQILI
jgi:hypothetical protein